MTRLHELESQSYWSEGSGEEPGAGKRSQQT